MEWWHALPVRRFWTATKTAEPVDPVGTHGNGRSGHGIAVSDNRLGRGRVFLARFGRSIYFDLTTDRDAPVNEPLADRGFNMIRIIRLRGS